MKLLICVLLVAAVLGADDIGRPVYDYPEWWVGRDFGPLTILGTKNDRVGRIVGGQEAGRHQFPYQVGLRMTMRGSGGIGLCGGSLITANRVLTAAHCVDVATSVETVFGAHFVNNRDEPNQVRRITPESGLIWHENYNPNNLNNDVAVINLLTAVNPVPGIIEIVNLPEGADLNENFAGQLAIASGWGRFSSDAAASEFLRFVAVEVISNLACRVRFPTIIADSTSKQTAVLSLKVFDLFEFSF